MSIKQDIDSGTVWTLPQLNQLRFMRANFVEHNFKPHAHDYFVIGLIEAGVQSFSHGRGFHVTTPGRLIIINPDEVHTGEAAIETGFAYRALYPRKELMREVVAQFKHKRVSIPRFNGSIIEDQQLFHQIRYLHHISEHPVDYLALETGLLNFFVTLVGRHASDYSGIGRDLQERQAIQQVRDYLEAHYAKHIALSDLADLVHIIPYHLARMFSKQIGMPPHSYLQNVRIRHAECLLKTDMPIADVAFATGFSSQSHLNRIFKQYIGTTPGKYHKQRKIV